MTDTVQPVAAAPDQLSACDALFDDPTVAADVLERAITRNELLDTLPPEAPSLSTVAARILLGQVVDQVIELLRSLPLSDMLIEGWSQLDKVAEAQAVTRLEGSTRNVSVLNHHVTITQEPTIEMLIDEVPVPLLTLRLDIAFDVTACDLRVASGEITRVEPGPIAAHGVLRSKRLTVIEHTVPVIDPTRLLGPRWPTS